MGGNRYRRSGAAPYWMPGTQIMWRSGSGLLAAGTPITEAGDTVVPQNAEPVTVVGDAPDALVVWLAAGTPVLHVARADGLGKRADTSTLFTAEPVQAVGVWTDFDVLRIAPTGRRWSAWAFFDGSTTEFAGWYVNLEDPHVRDEQHGVYTSDHVLDLEITPDRCLTRKDGDELALAVEQGRFDAATAAAIEAEADEVEVIVREWGPPFCDGWEKFRPDPDRPVPEQPGHEE